MSFEYNPLKHIELVDDPPKEGYSNSMNPDTFAIYCHSCGSAQHRVSNWDTIGTAFAIMREHVKDSHSRTKEDFTGWSIY